MEEEYPLLKAMKNSEIFLECYYIVRGSKKKKEDDVVTKFYVGVVMPKKELQEYVKQLKITHKIDDSDKRYERLNIVTISKT